MGFLPVLLVYKYCLWVDEVRGVPGVTPNGIPNEYSPVINVYQVFATVLLTASHGAWPARGPAGVTVGVRPDSGARFGI